MHELIRASFLLKLKLAIRVVIDQTSRTDPRDVFASSD
jgi:hypothetical protein